MILGGYMKIITKTLVLILAIVCLVSNVGCFAVDNYKEYPLLVDTLLGKEFEYNGIKYIRLDNPYWNNSEDEKNFRCLWDIKKEEFNEIVGKFYSSTYRPITAPMYKHDVLGWDCLFCQWKGKNIYLNENYVLPKEKDLTISYIYAKQINGQNCLKGKDVDAINEKVKEDVFINVKMKDIINENVIVNRDASLHDFLEGLETYCVLEIDIFFDSSYFYLETYFYVYQSRVFVELNDYIYEVKSEYATQIYNYVSEK